MTDQELDENIEKMKTMVPLQDRLDRIERAIVRLAECLSSLQMDEWRKAREEIREILFPEKP